MVDVFFHVCIEFESHCIPTPTCADQDDEWHKDNDGSKDRHDTGGTAPGGGPYPDMTFNEDCIGNQSRRSKPSHNSHLHHTSSDSSENERRESMIKMSVNASDMMFSLFQRGCQCQILHDCAISVGFVMSECVKGGKLWETLSMEVQSFQKCRSGGAWSTLTGRSVVHFKPTRKLTFHRQPKKSPAEQCLSFSSAYVQSVSKCCIELVAKNPLFPKILER